jgi:hypothetical protein
MTMNILQSTYIQSDEFKLTHLFQLFMTFNILHQMTNKSGKEHSNKVKNFQVLHCHFSHLTDPDIHIFQIQICCCKANHITGTE